MVWIGWYFLIDVECHLVGRVFSVDLINAKNPFSIKVNDDFMKFCYIYAIF